HRPGRCAASAPELHFAPRPIPLRSGKASRSQIATSTSVLPPLRLSSGFGLYRRYQHPVDPTAVHLDPFNPVVSPRSTVGSQGHAIEPGHQIAAKRVKVRVLTGQARNPEDLLQLVESDHAVDQPGAVISPDDPLIGVGRAGNIADQCFEYVAWGN